MDSSSYDIIKVYLSQKAFYGHRILVSIIANAVPNSKNKRILSNYISQPALQTHGIQFVIKYKSLFSRLNEKKMDKIYCLGNYRLRSLMAVAAGNSGYLYPGEQTENRRFSKVNSWEENIRHN